MTTPVHISHRHLGRCGLKVSALTLGAMTFGESESFMRGVTSSDEEARNVLDAAIDAGIDTIDTANVYSEGRSEQLLGQWLEGRRHKVTLLTKCRFPIGFGTRAIGPHDQGLSRKHIISACEDSLRRLRTDYIDLYQVHMQDRHWTGISARENSRARIWTRRARCWPTFERHWPRSDRGR